MNLSKSINTRIQNNIIEMTASLSVIINKAEKKPSIEKAELIKALSEGIANLLKVMEEDDGPKNK